MFVRILSLIYLTTFVCGQSTNTCTSLKQCLDSANQCEQLKVSQTTISPPFTAKMLEAARKRLKLVNCPDASVTEILKNSAEGRVKTAQRQDRVARCIAGDISSFPGCPALPLPPANSLSRDCPNNIFKRQTRPAAAQCNKDQCRNYFCGCPEAHLCHECYELSQLHDEVHLIQLTHKLQLARCSGNVASRDGTIPDQEDSISTAFVGI